jgi:hypothetical protein
MNILSYEIITEQTHDGKWWYTLIYTSTNHITGNPDTTTCYCYRKHDRRLDAYFEAKEMIKTLEHQEPYQMESRPDYVDDFIYNEALKTRGLYPERIEK